MKALKITEENVAALDEILRSINCRADKHTYNARGVLRVAYVAEANLQSLGIAKARRAGARVTSRSGDSLLNAYKYSRNVNRITIERRSSAWYLTDVKIETAYNNTERDTLHLSQAQKDEAEQHLLNKYNIRIY